ncbi:hypothetical protein AX761_21735 [Rhizobium sp. 58]|nr:hypothetical protein AX761_21735 [Rhizobium sp. 58]
MSSEIFICNLALSNIGKQNISDLNEAGAEARACRQFYAFCRDTLLQVYPWRFAGKTQSMGQIVNDKPGAWGYAYNRPNDCLKVRYVRENYSLTPDASAPMPGPVGHPYEIEDGKIYCNLSPALLRYTWRIIDPTKFPPLFIDALSWSLSARLSMPLTKDLGLRNSSNQAASATRLAAEAADANEERETSDITSELVAERG